MAESSASSTDLLGTAPIGRLLLKFSVPAIVASVVNALYNLVDILYLAHFQSGMTEAGKGALVAGLTVTLPYTMALASFGVLVGAGSSALLSIRLGEGDHEGAEKIVGQTVALKVLFFIVVPFVAYLLMEPSLRLFGATESAIPYAKRYLNVILLGSIFLHLGFGMSGLIRAEGNATMSMAMMVTGAFVNMVLDSVFIFGGFGLPWIEFCGRPLFIDLGLPQGGIAGAAWATNIAMFVSTAIGLYYLSSRHSPVRLRLHRIRIYPRIALRVFAIGLSPALLQIVLCFVSSIYLHGYKRWGGDRADIYLSAIGIIRNVHAFLLVPTASIAMAAQPILGYNFGAGLTHRTMKCLRQTMNASWLSGVVSFLILMAFAPALSRAFTSDPEILRTTTWGMRVLSAGFWFYGPDFALASYMQSVGRAKASVAISLIRQVFFLVPLILFLPPLVAYFKGDAVNGVWYAQPISDTVTSLIFLIWLFGVFRAHRETGATDSTDPHGKTPSTSSS